MKVWEKIEVHEKDGKMYFRVICQKCEDDRTFSHGDAVNAMKYLLLDEKGRREVN